MCFPGRANTELAATAKPSFAETFSTKTGGADEGLNPRYWYIHGRPYDLTEWMDDHPGGSVIIKASRGTDCTVLFETYHAASLRSEWITTLLQRYAVEGVPCKSLDPAWTETPFYDDLRQVVQAYRMEHGTIKATKASVAWYAVWGVVHYCALAAWLAGPGDQWVSWAVSVVLAVSMWFWCADLLHHGTHYALCKSSRLSRWIGMAGGWMFCLPHTWTRQHVTGHHVHTNENAHDPDLYHFLRAYDVAPWPSTHKVEKLGWWWHIAPVFTQFVPPSVCTFDLLSDGHWVGVSEQISWYEGEQFTMGAVWVWYLAAWATVGYLHGVLWAVVPSLLCGCIYYCFSQSFAIPRTDEWAVREMTTSQGDYAYDSWLWNKLSIGLNNQTMHHLFPSIHPSHFPALSKPFYKVFRKHDLPLDCWKRTYWHALEDHCSWIRHLNP